MTKRAPHAVPAFLSFDVEPDAFQIAREDREHWPGYAAMFDYAQALRESLARVTGSKPSFGWYFRMDPQIEEVCGRADVAVTAFPERFDALREAGDHFGVHAHPLRWSDEQHAWVHDFADARWLRACTQFSLDTFRACVGEPAALYRAGAGFLTNDIVDVLDCNGVTIEMGLEPVAGWGLTSTVVPTAIDSSPIVGAYTDCGSAPRTPYHPSREDFRRAGNGDARRLLFVPLSTTTAPAPTGMRSKVRRLFGRGSPEPARVLYPSVTWPSAEHFWNLVAREIESMERPYLSLGLRTDQYDAALTSKVRTIFGALASHPVASRLRFVNPLQCISSIAPQRGVRREAEAMRV